MDKPCEKCAPFGGAWMETEKGLRRCDCPRGRALRAADLERNAPVKRAATPVVSEKSASFATEALGALPFFPGEPAARTMIGHEIQSMCQCEEDVLWLVQRMIRLYGDRWPGPAEMRRVYCNSRRPLDGIEAIGESEKYPDGIPAEHQEAPKALPAGQMKALPLGTVSAAPSVNHAVKSLAAGKDLNRPQSKPPAPVIPLVPPDRRITAADIKREVEALRDRRARIELGGEFVR